MRSLTSVERLLFRGDADDAVPANLAESVHFITLAADQDFFRQKEAVGLGAEEMYGNTPDRPSARQLTSQLSPQLNDMLRHKRLGYMYQQETIAYAQVRLVYKMMFPVGSQVNITGLSAAADHLNGRRGVVVQPTSAIAEGRTAVQIMGTPRPTSIRFTNLKLETCCTS